MNKFQCGIWKDICMQALRLIKKFQFNWRFNEGLKIFTINLSFTGAVPVSTV